MNFEGRVSLTPFIKVVAVTIFALCGFVLFYSNVFAADGDVTNISLYDGNGNGKIDEVRISVTNSLLATWSINGTPVFAAEAGDGGAAITVVSSALLSAADANPVVISVAIDESDSDLTINTAVTALAITYTQNNGNGATCVNCWKDGTNELATIATGDTGAGDTEVDSAAPQISTVTYVDNDADGKIDRLTVNFSESIVDASVFAADNITLSNVGDFTGAVVGAVGTDLAVGTISTLNVDLGTEATVLDTFEGAGTIAVTTTDGAGNLTLTDGTGNINTTPKLESHVTYIDGAKPQISSFGYKDSDLDGMIDGIQVYFTETVVAASSLAAADLVLSNVGDFTGAAFGASVTDLITTSVSDVLVPLGTEATAVDTYSTITMVLATTGAAFNLDDAVGNSNVTAKTESQVTTISDLAKPVITSATPTDGATLQSRFNALVYNFSEPIATAGGWVYDSEFAVYTTGYTGTNPGGWGTAAWSNSDETVTISHAPFLCSSTYSFSFTASEIVPVNGQAGYLTLNNASSGPISTRHEFDTSAAGCDDEATADDDVVSVISVNTPTAGQELVAGSTHEITWATNDEGSYYVDLYYMNADGEYVAIATALTNDGAYTWTVPNVELSSTVIYVDWNDLAASLDTATSDSFSIVAVASDSSDDTTDEDTATTGTNPFTGEVEVLYDVNIGDFFTSVETSTVYYLDSDGTRRPFMNSAAYFTWADSWDEVTQVTGATLTQYELGSPMLPREGITMVKIQSDVKTYVIEGDNTLRWVTSEEVAESLYGASWNAYIIDIEPTFFSKFIMGDDVETASDYSGLDGKTAKTRAVLSA